MISSQWAHKSSWGELHTASPCMAWIRSSILTLWEKIRQRWPGEEYNLCDVYVMRWKQLLYVALCCTMLHLFFAVGAAILRALSVSWIVERHPEQSLAWAPNPRSYDDVFWLLFDCCLLMSFGNVWRRLASLRSFCSWSFGSFDSLQLKYHGVWAWQGTNRFESFGKLRIAAIAVDCSVKLKPKSIAKELEGAVEAHDTRAPAKSTLVSKLCLSRVMNV